MLLKTAQVSPYLFTLVLLAIMLVINGISDYVQMDDEFAPERIRSKRIALDCGLRLQTGTGHPHRT